MTVPDQDYVCAKLHDMVDQLADIPADMWESGLSTLRLTIASETTGERFTLVAGIVLPDELFTSA